jgi:hypothetical protein
MRFGDGWTHAGYNVQSGECGAVTLHPKPYTLHPTPYTLHPTPYTPHPTPYAPDPAPCT